MVKIVDNKIKENTFQMVLFGEYFRHKNNYYICAVNQDPNYKNEAVGVNVKTGEIAQFADKEPIELLANVTITFDE